MLHGIGGRTIAEAKQRLAYPEALQWFAYMKKHGTPNQHLHHGFAMVASLIANALGNDTKPQDFMLKHGIADNDHDHEDEEATLEDVFAILTGKR